ncbi:MAG: hypothetical protein RL642_624, partial [Bacteroidota bacterium]
GSCGRDLCCSSWLNEFKRVTTAMARYQNLSINQTKLSGQCGRLKCCLNYELDTYLDALQHFPEHADVLETAKGRAQLIKKDIFKNLMWYTLPDSNKQYPLSIDTVRKIKSMNEKGIRPEELETADVTSGTKVKEVEPQFVDVVGQISLRSLERNAQKRKSKGNREQGIGNREQGAGNREKGLGNREKGLGNRGPRPNQPANRQSNEGPKARPQVNKESNQQPRTKPSIQIKKGDQ